MGKDLNPQGVPSFGPLFDGLDLERRREISIYMDLDAKVNWDNEKIKVAILSALNQAKSGTVVSL